MVGEVPRADEPLSLVRLRTKTSQESLGDSAFVTPKRLKMDDGSPSDGKTSGGSKSTGVPESFLGSKLVSKLFRTEVNG